MEKMVSKKYNTKNVTKGGTLVFFTPSIFILWKLFSLLFCFSAGEACSRSCGGSFFHIFVTAGGSFFLVFVADHFPKVSRVRCILNFHVSP